MSKRFMPGTPKINKGPSAVPGAKNMPPNNHSPMNQNRPYPNTGTRPLFRDPQHNGPGSNKHPQYNHMHHRGNNNFLQRERSLHERYGEHNPSVFSRSWRSSHDDTHTSTTTTTSSSRTTNHTAFASKDNNNNESPTSVNTILAKYNMGKENSRSNDVNKIPAATQDFPLKKTIEIIDNNGNVLPFLEWDRAMDILITSMGIMTTANVPITDPTKGVMTMETFSPLSQEREQMIRKSVGTEQKLSVLWKYRLFKVEDHEKKLNYGSHPNYIVAKEYIYTDYMPTRSFYDALGNTPIGYTVKKFMFFTTEDLHCAHVLFAPRVALLRIEDIDTEIPTGMQSHLVLYNRVGPVLIVFSYLTSQKDGNIFLSPYQPFDTNPSKPQDQMLHMLDRPFIIKYSQLDDAKNLTQDMRYLRHRSIHVGNRYVLSHQILNTVKKAFMEHILPKLSEEIPIYDGTGIKEHHMDVAISNFEAENKRKAVLLFENNYTRLWKVLQSAEKSNNVDPIKKEKSIAKAKDNLLHWMTNTQRSYPQIYPHIKLLVNQYNKENNVAKQYE